MVSVVFLFGILLPSFCHTNQKRREFYMTEIHETELLNYIRQNAEAALNGIDMIENEIENHDLKALVKKQKNDYHSYYAKADSLLHRQNGTPENMPFIAKMSATVAGNFKKLTYKDDRDVAKSMIEGTSMGINDLTKHLHEYKGKENETKKLAENVIAFEEACIEDLKPYL